MSLNHIHDATRDYFAAQWILNAHENSRASYCEDLGSIKNYLDVEKALICGTGPTLNDHETNLKQIMMSKVERKRYLIIANHSNLATLLYWGIAPDMVVITDSGDPTFHRLERDVLPHFKSMLKKQGTVFVLASHSAPQLLKLLNQYHMPIYLFVSALRELDGDTFAKFYNQLVSGMHPFDPRTHILQAGCVSNASVLVCNALKLLGKTPSLSEVFLLGVDFGYPDGITRCCQVTYNKGSDQFDVDDKPTFLGKEIQIVRYHDYPTSEEQMAYYRDLRFIQQQMIEAQGDKAPFKLYVSRNRDLLRDFLPTKPYW